MITMIGNALFCIASTLICYFISLKLFQKYNKSWLNPLYTASFLLISILLSAHIQGEIYSQGSIIFNYLLQLAVVSLAVPLYKQWSFLKRNFQKILAGVISGTALGVTAVMVLSSIFHLKEQLLASLIPRSVTLPIALTISTDLGGLTSITVIFVVVSAFISLIIGPNLLKHVGIKSKSAKGLAMGTSAQMLGANRCIIWGEEESAMGSIAMTTSALFLTLLVPILQFIL